MPEAPRGEWPVDISMLNGGTGATLVFRWHGRLHLTAVVKATLSVVPGGVMTLARPEPIARGEQEYPAGLRTAGDLVPFRRRAEVLITGHAFVPPGPPGATVPVRVSVTRDGATVLERSIALQVPVMAGEPLPDRVRLFGLGPLSRHWPVRSRLIGAHDPRRFEGPTIDLPADFDESYFQAAPAEQRVDRLSGDEQIVIDGARPDGARLVTRLPGVRVVARLFGPGATDVRPFELGMDTLHLDLDQGVCNVTWRGVAPVDREDGLGSMRVMALVEQSPRESVPATMVLSPGVMLPTMMLSPDHVDLGGTQGLDLDAVPPPSVVLPFAPGPAPEQPSRWASRPPPSGIPTGTLGLSVDRAAEAAAQPAVPFPGAVANPPRMETPSWRPQPVATPVAHSEGAPVAPVAEAADAPKPKDADISLERCAAIAAELGERRAPRAAVLAAAGVSEIVWSGAERLWSQVIEREVALGHHALRDAYDTAYVAAWEKLRGPLAPADYASLRAAPPTRLGAALDAAGIRRAVWPRIHRVWKRRIEESSTLAEAVAEASRALGGPTR